MNRVEITKVYVCEKCNCVLNNIEPILNQNDEIVQFKLQCPKCGIIEYVDYK